MRRLPDNGWPALGGSVVVNTGAAVVADAVPCEVVAVDNVVGGVTESENAPLDPPHEPAYPSTTMM